MNQVVKRTIVTLLALVLGMTSLMPLATASAVGTNLITNPSVETTDAAGTNPTSWTQNKWGTNTTAFTYKTTEGQEGTKSLNVAVTAFTSGDAKWMPASTVVKPSQKYTYSEFYKSNVATEVDIEYTDTTGKLSYAWVMTAAASAAAWAPITASFTTPANVKSLRVFHVINKVGTLQTDNFNLIEGDGTVTPPAPTAPTVSITAPVANATISNTQAINATATDAVGVAGVQFKIDGTNIGTEDTVAPYSVNLDTKTVANGTHSLTATARNTSNLTTVSTVSVNVQNTVAPTAPTVSITAPTTGATLANTQTITANAGGTQAITSVQFKLDGANLGTADTSAPYSISWDTKTATNGSHTLTAVATNSAALSTTSTPVTVTVQNTVVTPPVTPSNLLPNPSFETASGTAPQSWISGNWGTNTSTFSYLTTGHTGSRSVKTQITAYTNGAANWYYTNVPVVAGKSYKYDNWYQSNVDTEVDAEVVMTNGTTQYFYLGTVPASTTWAQTVSTFTPPVGAKSVSIYQILTKVGYLTTDDYSLAEYVPAQFANGIVSLTFDDGWRSIYTNGLPLLKKYNFVSTQYLLTGTIDYPDYMTVAMMQAFKTQGSEIASHTIDHLDLTQQTAATMNTQLSKSKTDLQNWLGVSVTNFATPYGAYNTPVLNAIKQYYGSHRSVEEGFNSKDNFNRYDIKVQNILNTTTPAQVKVWVDQAIRDKTWLVLVYHEVDAGAEDPTYAVTPANLDAELSYIKQTGVSVKTVNQALNEITPQL